MDHNKFSFVPSLFTTCHRFKVNFPFFHAYILRTVASVAKRMQNRLQTLWRGWILRNVGGSDGWGLNSPFETICGNPCMYAPLCRVHCWSGARESAGCDVWIRRQRRLPHVCIFCIKQHSPLRGATGVLLLLCYCKLCFHVVTSRCGYVYYNVFVLRARATPQEHAGAGRKVCRCARPRKGRKGRTQRRSEKSLRRGEKDDRKQQCMI